MKGTTFHAELSDASGLRTGAEVQVAGVRVGRVSKLNIGTEKVIADFDVKDAKLGRSTRASVEVKSLLGEKFLNIKPEGSGQLPAGATIPISRTDAGADIVGTLGQLTTQTEQTNKENLTTALNTLAEVIDTAAPEVQSSFSGLSRLSSTIATRDEEIEKLLARSRNVTALLDERKGDLVTLMEQADRHLPGAAEPQAGRPRSAGQRDQAWPTSSTVSSRTTASSSSPPSTSSRTYSSSCTRVRTRSRHFSRTTART